jgi:hypothetical protein
MTLMKQLFTDIDLFINILLTHRVFLQEKNAIRITMTIGLGVWDW